MLMEQEELKQAYLIQLILGFLEEMWALGRSRGRERCELANLVQGQKVVYTMAQEGAQVGPGKTTG